MVRRILIIRIKTLFAETKKSPYWEKIKKLPIVLRYTLALVFVLFWLLGMLTPIPAGVVFLMIGIALFVGIHRARSWTIRFAHFTRLHILYAKVYMWWHMRKR